MDQCDAPVFIEIEQCAHLGMQPEVEPCRPAVEPQCRLAAIRQQPHFGRPVGGIVAIVDGSHDAQ
jgi:hypothetical protein